MGSDRDYISLLGQSLGEGQTVREICPRCGGGSSSEKSLGVTRKDGGVVWQCFRAKCGYKGAIGSHGQPAVTIKAPKKRVWEGQTMPFAEDHAQRIRELWNMDPPESWWWTTDYGGRVAMSIRSPRYTHRGWVLRSITGGTPKALTYVHEGEEGLSWYREHTEGPTIVVEDIPSAVRASRYYNSVALCGTGVGLDRASEIAQYGTRPIIMALDQDATAQSFALARRYALLWGDVKVLPLKHDIKDMKENDIETLLV